MVADGTGPKETPLRRRVVAEGHLIDTGLMSKYLDIVLENGGRYELLRFDIGRTLSDYSKVEMAISAPNVEGLERILENLLALGCHMVEEADPVILRPSTQDGTVPDEFYSTTNHHTRVFHDGRWRDVADQRMDAVIVLDERGPRCVKLRDVSAGDLVVCGLAGVQVFPPFRPKEQSDFVFMHNEVSSERRVELAVASLAATMRKLRVQNGRMVVVAGPVVVHTGGSEHLSRLVRRGYVQALLSGNAIGVHDVEASLMRTSLGVDLGTGIPVSEGHRNHMRAINVIRTHGSLRKAVAAGVLQSGLMFECIRHGVDLVLAGSIRDDGPLPDTITDMIEAQRLYGEALKDTDMVLILGTMLHGIGVGNMIPSSVRTVCVDINPATVTKLVDRGSAQASGVVSDVGLFLRLLADELQVT